jgi:hypothetical protein
MVDPKRAVARTVTPAFTLHQIGKVSLQLAESHSGPYQVHLITALLMCPLTMEAVLNELGQHGHAMHPELQLQWPMFEWLRPKQKLAALASLFSMELDLGIPPFQVFTELFEFRSALVHGKTERFWRNEVPVDHFDASGYLADIPDFLMATWEKKCTVETAHQWRAQVFYMSAQLSGAADWFDPLESGDPVDYWNTLPREG